MLLLEKIAKNWNPEIGDPTPIGWITVVAYFLTAALLIFHIWESAKLYPEQLRSHLLLLTGAFLILAFLGLNKQLDLQSLFTAVGRDVAQEQGWYDGRKKYQYAFIGILLAVSVVGFLGIIVLLRKVMSDHWLLLLGLLFLVTFVLVRASSVHMMDTIIGAELGKVKINWVLELGGIFIVAAGSVFSILRRVLHQRFG